ncbi:MAG: hypothetical protein GY822_03685 [Deltaproteobacteria bacterium]|nr:hypothetical protein [Deltaproteobacteria bacterium]
MSAGDDSREKKSSTTGFDKFDDAYPIPTEGEDPFTAAETIRTDAPIFDFAKTNSPDTPNNLLART